MIAIAWGPKKSLRDGWGARTKLKDSSSTDIVVHAGNALTEKEPFHPECFPAENPNWLRMAESST